MRKYLALLAALLILFIPSVYAAGADRIQDMAGLLYESQEQMLRGQIEELARKYQFDAVIVTVDSLEGKTPEEYADDYFDYNGYGYGEDYDGILLLISMEYRDWAISTSGRGQRVFTDYGLDYISSQMVPYLSRGSYYSAFERFLSLTDDYLDQAEQDAPFDVDNRPAENLEEQEKSNLLILIAGSLIVGLIAALIVTGSMKSKLKSVRPQPDARQYSGELKLTLANDIFLYRTITKSPRPTQNSSSGSRGGSSVHTSSSGRSHGGSNGKF